MLKSALIAICLLQFSAWAGEQPAGDADRLQVEAVEAVGKGTEFVLYSLDPGPITFAPAPPLLSDAGIPLAAQDLIK